MKPNTKSKNPVGRPRIFRKDEDRIKLHTYLDRKSYNQLKLMSKTSHLSISHIVRELIDRYAQNVTLQLVQENIQFSK